MSKTLKKFDENIEIVKIEKKTPILKDYDKIFRI